MEHKNVDYRYTTCFKLLNSVVLLYAQTHEFLDSIGQSSSIYGLHKDTVSSLLLTMLPPLEHDYGKHFKQPAKSTPAYEVRNRVMEMMLETLKKNAGFVIPEVSSAVAVLGV